MTDPFSEEEGNRDMAMPSSYKKAKDLADTAAQAKQADATEQLLRALKNKQQLSPSQGMAAALLATIPTIGGYLIGKSVGSPDIPEGTRFDNMSYKDFSSAYAGGGGIGGAMGAKLGGEISQGYENRIYEQQKADDDVLMELYKFKSKEADRLQQTAADLEKAGLAAQEKRDYLPIQEAAELERQKKLYKFQAENKPEDPAIEIRRQELELRKKRFEALSKGQIPSKLPVEAWRRISAAESLPTEQERLRTLYQKAAAKVPPGFTGSFYRKLLGVMPANDQQEFLATLDGVAMQLNKALDPSPAEGGRLAQKQKLIAAIENGNFTNALDSDLKASRAAALASLRPHTLASNKNQEAVDLYNQYTSEWGDILSGSEDVSDLKKLKDEAAAIRKQLGME